MKKKLIILSAISVTCLGAVGIGASLKATDDMLFAGAESGNVWVHYAKKAATKTEKGIREYWVNCQTNEHVFAAPTSGTIQEGTQYNTSGFTEDDDRWILPVSLAAQDVVMTSEKKALNLGDYAGGVISSIKAGSFDLGVDASNLDVSKFASDHKDDGFYTVEVETVNDDKAYAIYADTTFVTAMISSLDDYKTYILPDTAKVCKYGYFKMSANVNVQSLGDVGSNPFFDWDASFSGTLDGNGNKIIGKSSDNIGALQNLKNATLKNLTIEDGWYTSRGCLLARNTWNVTLTNVTFKITAGNATVVPEVKDGAGWMAYSRFMGVSMTDCTFDASGYNIGSLFGRGGNWNGVTAKNCVVKAKTLTEAMHSNYTTKTYQPENVKLKEGEEAIKGLTFVQA